SLNWSTSWAAVSGFEVSSWYWMSSFSFLPPTGTPPLSLTTFLQTSYPSRVRMPSRASDPVSDSDAPSASVPVLSAPPFVAPLEPHAAPANNTTVRPPTRARAFTLHPLAALTTRRPDARGPPLRPQRRAAAQPLGWTVRTGGHAEVSHAGLLDEHLSLRGAARQDCTDL